MKISKKCQYALKAVFELEKLETGAILGVLLDEGEPVRNVSESFTEQGQKIIEVKNLSDHFCVKVRRKNNCSSVRF